MSRGAELIVRLDAALLRLKHHAAHADSLSGLTDADGRSGERWEAGQVFAHLAEFGDFWVQQAGAVVEQYHGGDPVPFGRTQTDPARVAAIERDRRGDPQALLGRCERDIAAARAFISGLGPEAWSARGVHPTLGVMVLPALLEEFIVGHYEQHCAQLDGLAGRS